MYPLIILCASIFALIPGSPRADTDARDAYGSSLMVIEADILVGETSGFSTSGMIHVLRENDRGSWDVVQTFASEEAEIGDRFGTQMAHSGGILAVSSPGSSGGDGAVFIFEKNLEGNWIQKGKLSAAGASAPGFGASLAVSDRFIFVGAPDSNGKTGLIMVYSLENGFNLVAMLQSATPEAGAEFGRGLAVDNGVLAVGSPGFASSRGRIEFFEAAAGFKTTGAYDAQETEGENRLGNDLSMIGGTLFSSNPRALRGAGKVSVFRQKNSEWQKIHDLTPQGDLDGPSFFGSAIAVSGKEIWISAPLAENFQGVVYRYDTESFKMLDSVRNSIEGGRTQFGNALAVHGQVAAIGMPGNDYGLGSAVIYENREGTWHAIATYNRPVPDLPPIAGEVNECEEGRALAYECDNVDLVSFIPLKDLRMNRGVRLNDVWGWTDEETGKEYGIIGHMESAVFVDVSDPSYPVVLGEIPRTPGSPGSTWRDMKVFKNHAFIVADGAGQHGMQVFDLTRLRDWPGSFQVYDPDLLYTNIASAHNIVINESTGFAYTVGNSSGGETCGGALHMIDINDPKNPTFVGCFNDPATGNQGSGATHDAQCVIYNGPDSEHIGKEICVGSNGTAISVADVSMKDSPIAISRGTYPNSAYVHQGWFTEDHRYFYQNDEGDETGGVVDRTRTMIWDLTDLDEPEMIAEYYGDANSTDHNLYVKGDYMYQTNNASGLRVIDIRDRANPVEVGYFDTTPNGKNVAGFDGTWSSFPYFKSGSILVTSRREGLFIVRKRQLDL